MGFSGEDDELESQPYTAENITNACARERDSQVEAADAANPAEPSHNTEALRSDESGEIQLPDTMLEVMVEMLNRSLPEYVVAALDKDAEKKYLFEQLDEPFKKFVADVNARSREWVARKWETRHKSLTKEVEEARVKVKELEEQRNAMQSAQLSAERQKRAVTDKVHELEARIATLEAEREQFDLERGRRATLPKPSSSATICSRPGPIWPRPEKRSRRRQPSSRRLEKSWHSRMRRLPN